VWYSFWCAAWEITQLSSQGRKSKSSMAKLKWNALQSKKFWKPHPMLGKNQNKKKVC
jgi:hypothetical protein